MKAGGTLVVFSQQHGYDFNVLPCGDEISAYGWLEDQLSECECVNYNRASDVCGQTTNTPNVNVDGHFTKWQGCNSVAEKNERTCIRVC